MLHKKCNNTLSLPNYRIMYNNRQRTTHSYLALPYRRPRNTAKIDGQHTEPLCLLGT